MFEKILIANRGEIAVRVIRTCKRLGVPVAVAHSAADTGSLAVSMADEAVLIGPAPAAESYLVAANVLAAAEELGADAIHPGFGFLSENADFARAVAAAGIAFIGPNPRAIEAMGDKITSKQLAKDAGVNVVPGHMGLIDSPAEAAKIAKKVGLPVMIKASAGGGGKGMRIAFTDEEVREGFASARSEAKSSFGDERIFIEKFIEQPRHIEIQVLGDKHGHVIHLAERECSIQRRNQKVIEEAPSPFLDAETRAAMGAQAVALAQAVDYDSAGTVEFIVDGDRNFYFLEMNTRLQVEHPVTEMITGLDLVEKMIASAAGRPLEMAQDDLLLDGWAMEARVYAEDPYRGFLPSIGRLSRYRPPADGPLEPPHEAASVRVDTGVEEGDRITLFYDPMIAKLVTHAPDRIGAIDAMLHALDRFEIAGLQDNTPFVAAVLEQDRFREGRLTTGYIAEEFPDGFSGTEPRGDQMRIFVGVAAYAAALQARRAGSAPRRDWTVLIGEADYAVGVEEAADGAVLHFPNAPAPTRLVTAWRPGATVFEGALDDDAFAAFIAFEPGAIVLRHRGATVRATACAPRAAALLRRLPPKTDAGAGLRVESPMPGLVLSVAAAAGQEVKAGQPLLVVEAMKMENIIRAERDAVVARIAVEAGASVATGDVLVEFAAPE